MRDINRAEWCGVRCCERPAGPSTLRSFPPNTASHTKHSFNLALIALSRSASAIHKGTPSGCGQSQIEAHLCRISVSFRRFGQVERHGAGDVQRFLRNDPRWTHQAGPGRRWIPYQLVMRGFLSSRGGIYSFTTMAHGELSQKFTNAIALVEIALHCPDYRRESSQGWLGLNPVGDTGFSPPLLAVHKQPPLIGET